MNGVRTYKALDYAMKLYGFWPGDLAVVAVIFTVVHGFFNSLLLDAATAGPAFLLAWRGRRRPAVYVSSLLSFASSPRRYPVSTMREARGS